MRRWIVLALVGVACKPKLPDLDGPDTTGPDDPPVEDTAPEVPEPRCAHVETEPNGPDDEPEALPLEALACGGFGATNDVDVWAFALDEETWLGVDVDAFALGSLADVSLSLSSDDADTTVALDGWNGLPDVRVRMPAGPSTWTALVRQTVGPSSQPGEGEDFFYELMASAVKAPVDWDTEELDNDAWDTPQVLLPGVGPDAGIRVFGGLDAASDVDVYAFDVPAGRHTVRLDVDAHEEGAVADFALALLDGSGARAEVQRGGEVGWESDPWWEIDSDGEETLVVEVLEERGRHGLPVWYVLTVTLEAL